MRDRTDDRGQRASTPPRMMWTHPANGTPSSGMRPSERRRVAGGPEADTVSLAGSEPVSPTDWAFRPPAHGHVQERSLQRTRDAPCRSSEPTEGILRSPPGDPSSIAREGRCFHDLGFRPGASVAMAPPRRLVLLADVALGPGFGCKGAVMAGVVRDTDVIVPVYPRRGRADRVPTATLPLL